MIIMLFRFVSQDNQIVFHDIQFNQGPIGARELIVHYHDISTQNKVHIRETFILQLLPGTPVSLTVEGWPDMEKVSALSSYLKFLY